MKDTIRIDDFFPDLSVEEKLIRVTAFQSILKGSPSTIEKANPPYGGFLTVRNYMQYEHDAS